MPTEVLNPLQKAHAEYEKYKELTKNELSEVEKHFLEQITYTTKKLKTKRGKNEATALLPFAARHIGKTHKADPKTEFCQRAFQPVPLRS